ncbi:hypothetical protein BU16DRAFT_144507 [Lophium mytilinum]|uniref:Heterokaryon incompatibility domain-containing protein n=1 Tax=Lophium mytilinum TaxID=390894 RepID=A0A6A6QGA0_9PEZI|nr:hypothetical protein BU16DRAFT_144507 [Lophium mytilinum]
MAGFYQTPLPKGSFRLLYLYAGADQDDIVGELKVFPFDSAPEYEALSYVWGAPEPKKSINLNGHEVFVGVNLFDALRGLRFLNPSPQLPDAPIKERSILRRSLAKGSRPIAKMWRRYRSRGEMSSREAEEETPQAEQETSHEIDEMITRYPICQKRDRWTHGRINTERIFWIDAVCIDQKNNEEKSHQVKMMGSIYKRAQTVLIWLGEIVSNELQALPILSAALEEQADPNFSDNPYPRLDDPSEAPWGYPPYIDRRWVALLNFFDKVWFERIWVIQEVVLATKALVLLGELEIPWDIVGAAASWLCRRELVTAALKYGMLHLGNRSRTMQRLHAAYVIHTTKSHRDIWNYFTSDFVFKCALPIDRVYSILDLFPELNIEPDYSIDPLHAFRATIQQFIEIKRDLVFLGLVNHGLALSRRSVSTWVRSWPGDPYFEPINSSSEKQRKFYGASGDEAFRLLPGPDNTSLRLHGVIVSQVLMRSQFMDRDVEHDSGVVQLFAAIRDFLSSIRSV